MAGAAAADSLPELVEVDDLVAALFGALLMRPTQPVTSVTERRRIQGVKTWAEGAYRGGEAANVSAMPFAPARTSSQSR